MRTASSSRQSASSSRYSQQQTASQQQQQVASSSRQPDDSRGRSRGRWYRNGDRCKSGQTFSSLLRNGKLMELQRFREACNVKYRNPLACPAISGAVAAATDSQPAAARSQQSLKAGERAWRPSQQQTSPSPTQYVAQEVESHDYEDQV